MIPLVITGALVLTCAAIGLMAFSVKRALDGNRQFMRKLADALGLPLLRGERAKPGPGFLKIGPRTYFILDLWKDRELNIYHIIKGYGKMQTVNAALDVPVDISKEFRMSIVSAGGFGMGGLLPGVSLTSTGDAAFDTHFMLKSNDAEAAKRILTPELRTELANVWNTLDVRGAVSVREGRVHYEESGWIQNETQRRRILAIAELANRLAATISPAGSDAPEGR